MVMIQKKHSNSLFSTVNLSEVDTNTSAIDYYPLTTNLYLPNKSFEPRIKINGTFEEVPLLDNARQFHKLATTFLWKK